MAGLAGSGRVGPVAWRLALAAALATGVAWPASVAWGEECMPRAEWQNETLRLRPHRNAFVFCRIDELTYAALLRDALAPAAGAARMPASVALGRLEEYPWLSRALIEAALADPGWSTKLGKPAQGGINTWVSVQLMQPAILARLAAPLEGSGLVISGVSVEKVLVRRVGDIVPDAKSPARRVPFDAQVWLVLTPVAPPGPVSAVPADSGR